MKDLPTVVASLDGKTALELSTFDGKEHVPNRDAVAFLYAIRLEPSGEERRLAVIFSGTVFAVKPQAFGIPDYGDSARNFQAFSIAAIGDYLDDSGLPTFASDLDIPQIECFSPHFQGWAERERASDDIIERYLTAHLFWSWKFAHEAWTVGPPDSLRLRSGARNTDRLIQLGEGEDYEILERTDDTVTLKPTCDFLRAIKKGTKPISASAVPGPTSDQVNEEHLLDRPDYIYVDDVRIADLRRIEQTNHDLRKLVALCEELNICYRSRCHHAVAALTRAVTDHVPPIFGLKSFAELTNNYAGARSFKECMQRLDGAARKIADGHLHTQIRSSESLPTRTQVNFSNDIDVLLAEIVRVLS